jgi:hypothetical protein
LIPKQTPDVTSKQQQATAEHFSGQKLEQELKDMSSQKEQHLQEVAEMKAQNGLLHQKIEFLQKHHLDELAEKNRTEQGLHIRVREVKAHLADQKLLVGIIIKKFQQAKLIVSDMKEDV